jgi:hypothetical protein
VCGVAVAAGASPPKKKAPMFERKKRSEIIMEIKSNMRQSNVDVYPYMYT